MSECHCPGGYWLGPRESCSLCGESSGRHCVDCETPLCLDCGQRPHPRTAMLGANPGNQ